MKSFLRIILVAILSIALFTSCKNATDKNDSNTTSTLYDDVMAVHDEVMPKMGTIHNYKKELQAITDTLSNPEVSAKLTESIIQLKEADDAMMSWMANFVAPKEEPKRTEYLNKEMTSIKEVKSKMLAAIKNAEQLLKEYK